MTKDEILKKVNAVFRDIFDNESINVTEKTTAADIEGWDSLNNIQLIVAIEKAFRVKFKTAEIRGWKNVGEMCDSLVKAA
jgi:acyl carrier protein